MGNTAQRSWYRCAAKPSGGLCAVLLMYIDSREQYLRVLHLRQAVRSVPSQGGEHYERYGNSYTTASHNKHSRPGGADLQ